MNFFTTLLCALILTCNCTETSNNESNNPVPYKIIKLAENNFVTLRGQIDENSASTFISDLSKIKSNDIYIYLVTPGGSIVAGNHIIQHMNAMTATGKKISCIADHAYSMGFVIFQACPTRYVMDHTIIMQHQASFTIQGPVKQATNRFKLFEKLEKQNNEMQSKRLGLTKEEFHDAYVHDWWLYGKEIIEEKAADELVNVLCDLDMDKSHKTKVDTWFGTFEVEYSLCPLIHAAKNVTLLKNATLIERKISADIDIIMGHYDNNKLIDNMDLITYS